MRKMKKIIATAVLALMAVAAVTSCGKKQIDATSLATTIAKEGQFSETLNEVSENVAKKRYGLEDGDALMCVSYKGTSGVVDEVAVIKAEDAEKVKDKMDQYKETQIKSYKSYMPTEVPKLEDAVIEAYGDTVIYCVSESADNAREIIKKNVE